MDKQSIGRRNTYALWDDKQSPAWCFFNPASYPAPYHLKCQAEHDRSDEMLAVGGMGRLGLLCVSVATSLLLINAAIPANGNAVKHINSKEQRERGHALPAEEKHSVKYSAGERYRLRLLFLLQGCLKAATLSLPQCSRLQNCRHKSHPTAGNAPGGALFLDAPFSRALANHMHVRACVCVCVCVCVPKT